MGQSHSHSNSAHDHFREKEKTAESKFPETASEHNESSKESKNSTEITSKSGLEALTSRQKFLLRQTWDIGKQDLDSLGFTTFTEVFENHPNLRDIFLSSWNVSQDDLALDDRLLSHGLRVSNIIGKVVDRLDDVPAIDGMLSELGKRHITYSVKSAMIPVIGICFISSFKPLLEAESLWTSEIEKCWKIVIDYITNALMSEISGNTENS